MRIDWGTKSDIGLNRLTFKLTLIETTIDSSLKILIKTVKLKMLTPVGKAQDERKKKEEKNKAKKIYLYIYKERIILLSIFST